MRQVVQKLNNVSSAVIKCISFDSMRLRCFLLRVILFISKMGYTGLISFCPVRRKLYTILRSPHIDKKSRQQLCYFSFTGCITISNVDIVLFTSLGVIFRLSCMHTTIRIIEV